MIMDGFSDKLSQHFASSQDMINANTQAEMAQTEKLQNEVKSLIGTISGLEEKINNINIQPGTAAEVDLGGVTEQLTGATDKLETHIHKENVRVYRNVQASLVDELNKQTEHVDETLTGNNQKILDELKNNTDILGAMLGVLNDQQKSQGQAISGMAAQMNAMEDSVKKSVRNRALLPLQIIMLIIVLGELAINVLLTLGYL